MRAQHEITVRVVSPEEADHGVAEVWLGDELFGFTRLKDGELLLSIEPRDDAPRFSLARTVWLTRWRKRRRSCSPTDRGANCTSAGLPSERASRTLIVSADVHQCGCSTAGRPRR
jgi:hypothetical protein